MKRVIIFLALVFAAYPVYNALGEKIWKDSKANEIQISAALFPKGIYYLRGISKKGNYQSKFVVE